MAKRDRARGPGELCDDFPGQQRWSGPPWRGRGRQPPAPGRAHIDTAASYWDEIYRDGNRQGVIYLRRQAAVLAWVDAIDASEAMVEVTAQRLGEQELEAAARVADAHALPFHPGRFDLVVAVGVIPWLHSPRQAVAEMARVLRPRGELIVSIAAAPLKLVRDGPRRRGGRAASRLHLPRQIHRLLAGAGLRPIQRRTVGFGPFTLLGATLWSDARSLRVDARPQALADRGVPGLRSTGWALPGARREALIGRGTARRGR